MGQSSSEVLSSITSPYTAQQTSAQESTTFRSLLVLVGDSKRAQELQEMLRTASPEAPTFLTHYAQTGREALLFLRNIHPDCVILEDTLPDMTGARWLSTLTPLGLHGSFPILYLYQTTPPPVLQAFCYQQIHLPQLDSSRLQHGLQILFRQWQEDSSLSFSKLPFLHLPRPHDPTTPAPFSAQGEDAEDTEFLDPQHWPLSWESPTLESPAPEYQATAGSSGYPAVSEVSSSSQGTGELSLELPLAEQWRKNLENSRAGLWHWRPTDNSIPAPHEDFPIGKSLQSYLPRLHPHDALRLQEDLVAYHKKEDTNELFSSIVRARPFDRKDSEETPQWHWFLCRGNLQKVPWSSGKEVWGFFVDITSFKEEEERLAYLASHDPLTGLANRALFMDRLQQTLERMNRRPDSPLALLFLDCDRFKSVNDAHGHGTGDLLLQQIARRISRTLRSVDTVARFGGDEFVVLLDNTPHIDRARLVAERLRQEMREPFLLGDVTLQISTSIGLLWHTEQGYNAKQLLDQADQAMYQAKHEGGDRLSIVYSSKI